MGNKVKLKKKNLSKHGVVPSAKYVNLWIVLLGCAPTMKNRTFTKNLLVQMEHYKNSLIEGKIDKNNPNYRRSVIFSPNF